MRAGVTRPVADTHPAPDEPVQQPADIAPSAELPAEYLRADNELLVESIELTKPNDPANSLET